MPGFGGYRAFAVSVGKRFIGDLDVWEVVDGRLYLNLDNKIKGMWIQDIPGNLGKANADWSSIRDKAPSGI